MADDARREYELAIDLFSHGKIEDAIAALEKLIAERPDFADAYESIGMMHYKAGRLDEAIAWMQRLAEQKPDSAMAHTNLSVFYMKKGMKEKAEEEKAIATVLNFSAPKK
jgi:tetratricopeptide (TPR) repeat protein